MPIREVKCPKGHVEEVLLIKRGDAPPIRCRHVSGDVACGEKVELVEISQTARAFPGADSWRTR